VTDIRIEAVTHRYGDRVALDELTLDLRPGVTALVGVNGAGKSTLLSVLATLVRPSQGIVSYGGRDWPASSRAVETQIRRELGLCPQAASLPGSATVVEFLTYVARLRGVPRAHRTSAVEAALEVVDLTQRRRTRCKALSGGMRKRLLIAQAIVHDPSFLLLDEPMESLDPEQRIRIRSTVSDLAGSGRSVLISSHVLADVLPVADRLVMIDGGAILFDDTPEQLGAIGREAVGEGAGVSVHEAAFLRLREGRRDRAWD
jgi:ABC-2 type transport system ATP-binding protein